MKKMKLRLAFALAVIGLLTGTIAVYAGEKAADVSEVMLLAGGTPVSGSSSHLVRNNNGVSVNINTSGLAPGHAFSIWLGVREDGKVLTPAGPFPAELDIVMLVTGGLSGGNGGGHFAGHVSAGPIGDANGVNILKSDGSFDNPTGASFVIFVRDHGPKTPGMIPEQTGEFFGGCPGGTGCTVPPASSMTSLASGRR